MLSARFLLLAAGAAICGAQSTFTPLRPPALPLAVKSPYLSTWQQAGSDGGNGGYLPGQWPIFWAGAITGWTGYVRVDNITYIWMGSPNVTGVTNYFVTQTAYEYTSTQSIFTFDVAGQVEMTVTFLSPVLPDTLLEMSLPYSYMDVLTKSLDAKNHQVQIYTDISAEWVSGDRSAIAQWSYGTTDENAQPKPAPPVSSATSSAPGSLTTYATVTHYELFPVPSHSAQVTTAPGQGARPSGVSSPPLNATMNSSQQPIQNQDDGGVAYHKVWRQTQQEFTELNQQAEWGYWYYATENAKNLTYQQGRDIVVRKQFIDNGFLPNAQDSDYRAINSDFPVFAFAIDVGTISEDSQNHNTFQLSLHQENCIYFEEAAGNTSVPCLWTQYFDDDTSAVEYFYNQYDNILSQSQAVDRKVETDSVTAGGDSYYSLTALATRQAFGTLEYTNSPTRPWVFMKEIASGGDIQTVDVIFPFHPIAIYFNPDILSYMLDPLFINQEAGYWPFAFAAHHLGPFPNATGFNNENVANSQGEPQPLEESADMILMTLAYAQRTNDNAFLQEHYSILRQWNEYLVNNSLIPGSQLSTDDFLGPVVNDTNLALKGIVGIEAMAQIANRTGHTADGVNFTDVAHDYINQWQGYGIAVDATPPHTTTSYGENSTFSILYNLFPDAMLGLQLVPQTVYDMQSTFYPTVFHEYGVPLRSTLNTTKIDWELWAASIASTSTKTEFINTLSNWVNQTTTSLAFSDFYDVNSGYYAQNLFVNRPVIGAMFALLALESAPSSGYVTPISN